MKDPVRAADGFAYDRESLQNWISSRSSLNQPITSPCTRKKMEGGIKTDEDLKRRLDAYLRTHSGARTAGIGGGGGRAAEPAASAPHILSVEALGRFLEAIDPIRDLLDTTLDGWEPPQVVVIGGQSDGKSTLLERITMLPVFPKDANSELNWYHMSRSNAAIKSSK